MKTGKEITRRTGGEKMTNLKPCPMCGGKLTMKDVYFYDDDGNCYSGASDQFVEKVGIACECGFHYSVEIEMLYDEEEDLYEGGRWERNFIALANRRYKGR